MPADVKSMFYDRQAPWDGLGERVEHYKETRFFTIFAAFL